MKDIQKVIAELTSETAVLFAQQKLQGLSTPESDARRELLISVLGNQADSYQCIIANVYAMGLAWLNQEGELTVVDHQQPAKKPDFIKHYDLLHDANFAFSVVSLLMRDVGKQGVEIYFRHTRLTEALAVELSGVTLYNMAKAHTEDAAWAYKGGDTKAAITTYTGSQLFYSLSAEIYHQQLGKQADGNVCLKEANEVQAIIAGLRVSA